MNKHNFFYFIKEGAVNMFSHGFMSFASVGITVACLLIMGTFTLVAVNANAMLAELESQNQVLAFVEKGMSEAEARALEKEILAVDNVASATFISNEEAAEVFRGRYEDDELFQLPDDNFRHRYAIDLVDIGYMSQTKAALEALPGIGRGNVNAYEDEAAGFITIRNVAGIVCVVLIAVLFVVSADAFCQSMGRLSGQRPTSWGQRTQALSPCAGLLVLAVALQQTLMPALFTAVCTRFFIT